MLKVNINITQGSFVGRYHFEAGPEIIGVFGASGHGKTTLLNAICGLNKPQSGYIELNGSSLYSSYDKVNCPIKNRKVGYVFQDYKLFPHLSIYKNLKYALPRKADKAIIHEIANLLGISSLLDKKPRQCSGGQKQRIAIGRTLLSNPSLLLMDEPFSAIDPELRQELMQYVKVVADKYQIPVMIVSHNFEDMLQLMDKVMYVEEGVITYFGDIFQVLSNRDFISNEKLFKQYKNVLKLKIDGVRDTSEGSLYEAVNKPTGMRFLINAYPGLQPLDNIRVALSPDDIVMATRSIYEISTSNQISGTLLRVVESPYMVKCVVDVGFLVLVTVTANALDRLNVCLGDKVWLLFKTTKLNVAANAGRSQSKIPIA